MQLTHLDSISLVRYTKEGSDNFIEEQARDDSISNGYFHGSFVISLNERLQINVTDRASSGTWQIFAKGYCQWWTCILAFSVFNERGSNNDDFVIID